MTLFRTYDDAIGWHSDYAHAFIKTFDLLFFSITKIREKRNLLKFHVMNMEQILIFSQQFFS